MAMWWGGADKWLRRGTGTIVKDVVAVGAAPGCAVGMEVDVALGNKKHLQPNDT